MPAVEGDLVEESMRPDEAHIGGPPDLVDASPEDFGRIAEEIAPLEVAPAERLVPVEGPDGQPMAEVSPAEAAVYEDAGLVSETVAERPALVRSDIDLDYVGDAIGRSNAERMAEGLPPIDASDPLKRPIELHHLGQQNDVPLAELKVVEHRGPGNNAILHGVRTHSEVDHGAAWHRTKTEHWKARYETLRGGRDV